MRMAKRFVFGLISIVFLFTACEDRDVRLQRFLLQGNQAMSEQEYVGARFYFEEAVKLEPCFTDALNNLGTLSAKQNHFSEAVEYFNKAIVCNSKFLPAYFNRANAYYDGKEYFNLLKDADFILSIKPDTVVGYVLRGLAQTKLKQYPEALATFNKTVQMQPLNSEHWINRGTIKYYQKDWSGAIADLKRSLQLQPNQPNAINALGLLAIEQNKLDSAKILFNKALAIKSQEPYYLNNLGFVYLLENKLDEAREAINKSITLDPDNAWAYRNKGIYYMAVADYVSAERLLAQSLNMDAGVDRIHFYYGQALLKNGKAKAACEQFQLSEKFVEGLVKHETKQACR
jgi:Flp pilus assembly protein TadD